MLSIPAAEGQAIRSLSKVGHIRTNSFDIYYADSLADQASRLGSFADACLEDLEGFFGFAPPQSRIPVLLSDIQSDLNGYSTLYPSERIVIYISGAGAAGELASLDDELYSVFLHELTHALTFSARSPLWTAVAAVAGDFVAPAAWIVPNALSEGTAVWVESQTWPLSAEAAGHGGSVGLQEGAAAQTTGHAVGAGLSEGATAPLAGRLNDPAALEPVFFDIGRGTKLSLWDSSGVADYPGSGSLPYLYGGLFVQYMAERYGPEVIPELWRKSSEGNIFAGFDGTLFGGGILGEITGEPPAALWDDFLMWAGSRALENGGVANPGIGAAGGRVGAFTADNDKLYYVDLERQAVFSLDLAAIKGDVGQGLQGQDTKPLKPVFLFSADGYIENIAVSSDGGSLEIDWIRQGSHGEIQPATYLYSLEKRTLGLLGDRKAEPAGAAMKNLHDSAARPFLHGARLDAPTGYTYGLIRLGSRSLPARMARDGNIEVLDSPLLFVRSLSPQWRRGPDEGGFKIALSATLSGGISRLVILEERTDGWKLYLQKEAPEGGVHLPILAPQGKVIYKANLGEGRQELRIAPVDSQTLSASFERLEATWIPLEEMRKKLLPAGEDASAKRAQAEVAALRPTLFPRLCASSRYPYADAESAGLVFKGSDLTERLAWTASTGWNFAAGIPEASIALGLSADEHYLSLAAADRALPASGSTPASRLSGVSLGHFAYRILLPVYKYVFASSAASLTGLQSGYVLADYFSPTFDYVSIGGSVAIGYSSMRKGPFAPFDQRGVSLTGGADYETLPGITDAFSLSCALSAALPKPALKVSLYGSVSPAGDLRFLPAGRYFSTSGTTYPSALSAFYPNYREYGALSDGSSWYLFGEAKLRLATMETGATMRPVRMPLLPSWTLRRISLWTGLRAAALDSSGALALPSSAFAKVEFDIAVLAGLAAEGHVALQIEGAWAFSPSMAGGSSLHFDFGLGATL